MATLAFLIGRLSKDCEVVKEVPGSLQTEQQTGKMHKCFRVKGGYCLAEENVRLASEGWHECGWPRVGYCQVREGGHVAGEVWPECSWLLPDREGCMRNQ